MNYWCTADWQIRSAGVHLCEFLLFLFTHWNSSILFKLFDYIFLKCFWFGEMFFCRSSETKFFLRIAWFGLNLLQSVTVEYLFPNPQPCIWLNHFVKQLIVNITSLLNLWHTSLFHFVQRLWTFAFWEIIASGILKF